MSSKIDVALPPLPDVVLDKLSGPQVLRAEQWARAAVLAEREKIEATLSDPINVHINMLRGRIAPITFDDLAHILGDEATAKWVADRQQRGGDVLRSLAVIVDEKFTSGNAIPVERITITRTEYDAAMQQQSKGEA